MEIVVIAIYFMWIEKGNLLKEKGANIALKTE